MVTADRYDTDEHESARATWAVSAMRLAELVSRATPDALDAQPGVFVQKSNHGGGQPIIRGRYGNHILLLYDGIRLNNSVFRGGCNQYLNTVGPFELERIEIVRGPASVQYGSDAVGGTVNVIPRNPLSTDATGRTAGQVTTRGQVGSADGEATGYLGVAGRTGPVAAALAAAYSDFGDLRAGGDVGVQPFTGYQQSTYDGQFALRLDQQHNLKLVYSGMRQINVPRTDVCTPGDCRYYDEQFRDLVYGKYRSLNLGEAGITLDATLSFQSHRERWRRTRIDKGVEERQRIEVATLGGWAQVLYPLGPSHLVAAGAEAYLDWVASGRTDASLDGEWSQPVRGKLAARADYTLAGLYLQDEWSLAEHLRLKIGGRLTFYRAQVLEDELVGHLEAQGLAFAGSLAFLWLLSDVWNLSVGLHQGHRAPNIYDLTATGRFAGGWDVANPDLRPEQALTFELGCKVRTPHFAGSIFYHYTRLDDLIARRSSTVDGSPTFDGLDVYQRDNIRRAAVQGVELNARLMPQRNWSLFLNATWTEGNDLSTGVTPLPRIPPLNGAFGIRLQTDDADRFVELYTRFAVKQDRLAVQDTSDVRIPPGGTPGFVALHARAGIRWAQGLIWTLELANLTDVAYRYHGSGIDQPGFSVRTALEYRVAGVRAPR